MDRGDAKRRIAVLLSDLGVLHKVRTGRTDQLADEFGDSVPEFWQKAVKERMPPKGSRDWRWCREYAVDGKVPQRKKRVPKASGSFESKLPVPEGECLKCAMEGGHDGECVYTE